MKHRSTATPILYCAALLMLGAAIAGCGLFATRDPEPPTSAGSNFEPPTAPTLVLRNLENALKFGNPSDYRRCFSDSGRGLPPFRFFASAQGIAAAPTLFADWSIEREEKYLRTILAELQPDLACSVLFTPSEITELPIGDSIQFTASYLARFPHTHTAVEQVAEGELQLTLRLSRLNEWAIASWRDVAIPGKTSWSVIKARFSN
ncbi:MAG: hypothetical protein IT211_15925 [Armatimonadetes bacterium]|nr:hypothetical protein [Armatimonadota bacterium]